MKILRFPPAAILAALSTAALGADFAVSGFGTLGYAISDQPFAYQRYIDEKGTFDRDSVFGVQVDATLTPQWGATVQAKLAPALDKDSRWEPTLSWAFLSWRPSNDWLLRAGKLRMPGFLNSENMDVGTTFEYARLPIELYSATPTQDFLGVSFTKTWELGGDELSLAGLWGRANSKWRKYFSDGVPGILPAGAAYEPIRIDTRGLVLDYKRNADTYRIGFDRAIATRRDGQAWPVQPVLVDLGGGIRYYNVVAGPGGVPARDEIEFDFLMIGADIRLSHDYRVIGEYLWRRAKPVKGGLNSDGGYLSLLKQVGHWTPYVSYSWLRSTDESKDLYKTLSNSSVPAFLGPIGAIINASQLAGAQGHLIYDQYSWALGTSYAVSATSKIKAEWLHTRVGIASSLFDAPAGGDISGKRVNVFSMSYNFVF